MRSLLWLSILAITTAVAPTQAHPGCPLHPVTLSAMRSCYRRLLVFAPSAADPRYKAEEAVLDAAADDMMDREVLLVPILGSSAHYTAPLDAPSAMLTGREQNESRQRFHTSAHAFRVILLGEDGGSKLSSKSEVSMEKLNSLIDSMPTRKQEMQRPHSN